ncbi:MAG TPA: hypothetical protein VGH80_09635 [Xanthomonadaceae bacterium]|jgi:hypothetical protein
MRLRIWLVIILLALASFGAGAALALKHASWEFASLSLIKDRAELRQLEAIQARLESGDAQGAHALLKQQIVLEREFIQSQSDADIGANK